MMKTKAQGNIAPKKRVIVDPSGFKKPAMRVSHIVCGRESNGLKIRYLLDKKGQGTRTEIPENIVLVRWRQRVWDGYRFSRGRLGPNIWNGLGIALGREPTAECLNWTVEDIEQKLESGRGRLGEYKCFGGLRLHSQRKETSWESAP